MHEALHLLNRDKYLQSRQGVGPTQSQRLYSRISNITGGIDTSLLPRKTDITLELAGRIRNLPKRKTNTEPYVGDSLRAMIGNQRSILYEENMSIWS